MATSTRGLTMTNSVNTCNAIFGLCSDCEQAHQSFSYKYTSEGMDYFACDNCGEEQSAPESELGWLGI